MYEFQQAYEQVEFEGIKKNMETETGLTAEVVRIRSPILMMDQLSCPVLILHGQQDRNVAVSQAYLLRDKLTELGKEFEIKIFPEKEHNIGRENLLNYSLNFFQRHLLKTDQPVKQHK